MKNYKKMYEKAMEAAVRMSKLAAFHNAQLANENARLKSRLKELGEEVDDVEDAKSIIDKLIELANAVNKM